MVHLSARWRSGAVLVVAFVLVVVWLGHGDRSDERFRATASVTSRGLDVSAQAVVTASSATVAEYAGVCFTAADGGRVDFPVSRDVALGQRATGVTSTGSLAAGSYTFATCVKVDGTWRTVGGSGVLVVSPDAPSQNVSTPTGAAPSVAPGASAGPGATSSGTAEPGPGVTPTAVSDVPAAGAALPVGDLPGWKQLLAEDFTTDVAPGAFPGRAYSSRWSGYDGFPDSSGSFRYDTPDVASVHDGVLDLHTRTENGTPLGAGVVALVDGDGTWGGRTYGRYSVRFRAEPGPGWGAAFLLWSDRDSWNDGEIDFAEGMTTATTIDAHNHRLDQPVENATSVYSPATWDSWHVATVEWTPDAVTFFLDGRQTGRSTVVPSEPLHLVLQTLSNKQVPPADSDAHVLVDWVAAYERA